MPVPSAITDLSTTLASNSPAGSDNVFPDLDNYLRAHAQFVALLRDGRGLSTEVSLASAATCDIGGAASMFVQITGTTTITSFGTNYLPRILRFAGVLTLTHNATTLILPTGANITTAAGDMCLAVPVGTSGWRVLQYQRASEGADFVSFLQSGTGASSRTVQSKLRDIVTVDDFGAVGDGVTNDTTALTNFFNSAIARPGVEHRLFAKTYAVSSVMPTINVSDVWITGEGAEIHDVGSLMTGTVLKWIGTAGTVGPLVVISSVSGASNQRVSRVKFTGIGIDCNSGTINYGLQLLSVWECDIDVCIANAATQGMQCQVVAALGEAKDVQRNKIRLKSRQVEAAAGLCFVAGGDSVANFSKNELWVDAQHKNTSAIYLANTDNNDWRFVRTYKVTGGTATESISCLGGPTEAERVRAERFWHLSTNLALHAYGTGSYTVGAGSINIFNLDVENGTPNPIVDTGATVFWKKDVTALPDTPWTTYTPTLSAISGTLTSASASGSYARRGNIMHVRAQISITTNGTAGGALGFTLPVATASTLGNIIAGKERASTGKAVVGFVDGGGQTVCLLQFYDGTYPGANGYLINVEGFYEVP